MCDITGRGRGSGKNVRKCEKGKGGAENLPKKCDIIFEQPLFKFRSTTQPENETSEVYVIRLRNVRSKVWRMKSQIKLFSP